jgi:hypothetical protein
MLEFSKKQETRNKKQETRNKKGIWRGSKTKKYKARSAGRLMSPTRHLGANKGYSSKTKYLIIKNHTLLSTTKCRVGARKWRLPPTKGERREALN